MNQTQEKDHYGDMIISVQLMFHEDRDSPECPGDTDKT